MFLHSCFLVCSGLLYIIYKREPVFDRSILLRATPEVFGEIFNLYIWIFSQLMHHQIYKPCESWTSWTLCRPKWTLSNILLLKTVRFWLSFGVKEVISHNKKPFFCRIIIFLSALKHGSRSFLVFNFYSYNY